MAPTLTIGTPITATPPPVGIPNPLSTPIGTSGVSTPANLSTPAPALLTQGLASGGLALGTNLPPDLSSFSISNIVGGSTSARDAAASSKSANTSAATTLLNKITSGGMSSPVPPKPTFPVTPADVNPGLDIKSKAGNGYYDSKGNFFEGTFDANGKFIAAGSQNLINGAPAATPGAVAPPTDSPDMLAAKQKAADAQATLDALTKDGTLTGDQAMQLSNTIAGISAQYGSLIEQAQKEKEQGMAKDIVAAGERGGFMSTQMAGQAALQAIKGGDFVGANGQLDKMKSDYDFNIQQLQQQQLAAEAQAKTQALTAARTGDQADLKNAQDAYDKANAISQQIYENNRQFQQDSQTIQQNIITAKQSNLQYASNVAQTVALQPDATGKIVPPTQELVDKYAKQYGVDPNVLMSQMQAKYQDYQKNQSTITKNEQSSLPTKYKEWQLSQTNQGFADFLKNSGTPDYVGVLAAGVASGNVPVSAIPAYGKARSQIMAQVLEKNPAFDFTGNILNFEAKKKYTDYINSPAYQNTIKYLDSVQPNLDEVVNLSNSIDRTQFPTINKAVLATMYQTGDPKVVAYATAVTETSDQIAKILQGGGTGSGTSDTKLKQAQELLNGSFTPDQLAASATELRNLLSNRSDALKKDTWQTIGGGTVGKELIGIDGITGSSATSDAAGGSGSSDGGTTVPVAAGENW